MNTTSGSFRHGEDGSLKLRDARSLYSGEKGSMNMDFPDNEAIAFYNHFGFIKLPDSGKMFLPMAQLEHIFIV